MDGKTPVWIILHFWVIFGSNHFSDQQDFLYMYINVTLLSIYYLGLITYYYFNTTVKTTTKLLN